MILPRGLAGAGGVVDGVVGAALETPGVVRVSGEGQPVSAARDRRSGGKAEVFTARAIARRAEGALALGGRSFATLADAARSHCDPGPARRSPSPWARTAPALPRAPRPRPPGAPSR